MSFNDNVMHCTMMIECATYAVVILLTYHTEQMLSVDSHL